MDLLDIAIAKQLAGGGGSGTDNYNDLSNLPKINDTTLSGNKTAASLGLQNEINSNNKLSSDLIDDTGATNLFVTEQEKLEWSGKQDEITNANKLDADLVDDAESTNKFVTAQEKETWNGKQNAIDSSHKLSSDLVDDTNHTNKFVTSQEKETWNGKQNAIDSDHKLSSSLISFTTAEAAALASGIDSSKVDQISTNQTNILLVEKLNGAKNYIDSKVKSQTITTGGANITVTVNPDKSFEIIGTTGSSDVFIGICEETDFVLPAGDYVLSGLLSSAGDGLYLYMSQGSSYVHITSGAYPVAEFSINSAQAYTVAIHLEPNKSYSTPQKIYPMISDKSAWDSGLTQYMPFALSNYDLTRLESEDRASLAEVVDSGAKNKVDIESITTTQASFVLQNRSINSLPAGSYVFVYTSTQTNAENIQLNVKNGSTVLADPTILGKTGTNIFEFTITSAANTLDLYSNAAGTYSNFMLCTQAAWKVSQKYVPYRPNWDLVSKYALGGGFISSGYKSAVANADLNAISGSGFALYNSPSNMPSGTSGYCFVRTAFFDIQAILQELVLLSTGVSYVRTKYGSTWNTWKQTSNT